MVQWLAHLPGTQEIGGSSPGRGMTDFCTSIFICLYIYMFGLVLLRLNVPVNNFSVMSGRSHQYFSGSK